ncbi:AraC family transcriptional regulator [Flavicella sp.]|uniref:helix-turn-helix domain-containing protein n=1 Tax=Flavicella sp. TaxID=2957742 RepID=UPI00301778C5
MHSSKLINILDENTFFKRVKENNLFRFTSSFIAFVIGGTIKIEINEIPCTHTKGHVVLISPGNIYRVIEHSDTLKLRFLLHDSESIRKNINFNFNRYDVLRIINVEKYQNILKPKKIIFKQLIDLVEILNYHVNTKEKKSLFKEQILIVGFSNIIYILMDALEDIIYFDNKYNSRKEEIAIDFIDLVSMHFKTNKTLVFYAQKLTISIKYLSICVKEITSKSPSNLIANALITEAKIMLISSKNTISIIAVELNFSDQYAFGKFFKKHTGLSPKFYRAKNKIIQLDTI